MTSFVTPRVSSKQSIFFQFEPKQTETQSVSVVFRLISRNQKKIQFVMVLWYRNNRNRQSFFETNQNKPKKSPKTLWCHGIETTETDRAFLKQTKTNRKKIQQNALY